MQNEMQKAGNKGRDDKRLVNMDDTFLVRSHFLGKVKKRRGCYLHRFVMCLVFNQF